MSETRKLGSNQRGILRQLQGRDPTPDHPIKLRVHPMDGAYNTVTIAISLAQRGLIRATANADFTELSVTWVMPHA
jgi:hypothetical protein